MCSFFSTSSPTLVICNHFANKLLANDDKEETIETYLDDIRRAKKAAEEAEAKKETVEDILRDIRESLKK